MATAAGRFFKGGEENIRLQFAPILLTIRQCHRPNVSQLPHMCTWEHSVDV